LHNLWLKDNRQMIADSKMRSLAFPLRWLKGYMKSLIADKRGAVALEASEGRMTRRALHLSSDRRGVAAMEFGILGTVLLLLLLPISDVASEALAFTGVKQTMRNIVAGIQYSAPPDITNPASTTLPWNPTNGITLSGYTVTPQAPSCFSTSNPSCIPPQSSIGNITIYITTLCGDPGGAAACTSADATNASRPKWYYLSANVRLSPIFLSGMTGGAVTYSERIQ
jgi:hypothetical protein